VPGQWAGAIPAYLSKMQTCTRGDSCSSGNYFFARREGTATLEKSLRSQRLSYKAEILAAHEDPIVVLYRGCVL